MSSVEISQSESGKTKTGVSRLNRDEVEKSLNLFHEPEDLIEIRILYPNSAQNRTPTHGFFDNQQILLDELEKFDYSQAQGVYHTLNKINPAKIQKPINVPLARAKKAEATSDSDIAVRSYLFIDVDPVQALKGSATEVEHELAIIKTKEIRTYLSDRRWAGPILADSGNGGNLFYRIDLPNDDESKRLVEGVLKALHKKFSDSTGKIDTAVGNAGRICKLLGTKARKGENSLERPHRFSRIVEIPDTLKPVPLQLLQDLADLDPPVVARQQLSDLRTL